MNRRLTAPWVWIAALTVTGGLSAGSVTAFAEPLVIKGDGSTFAYPMYSKWIEEYGKQDPGVEITYKSNGSGAGIHDIMLGTVDFAGTDGPLTKVQMLDFSTHRNCEVLHFPTALGADVPVYNIPGIKQELRFSPEALAKVYLGQITKWNDPTMAKVNPEVSLPDEDIVVVHRQDGSGTTYVWTDYLSKVSTEWRDRVGGGISVNWPLGLAGKGNEGVAAIVQKTPYSIGYTELTYAVQNDLSYGSVQNSSGKFVKADFSSVTAAAAGATNAMTNDFRVSITNAPGPDAYPISSFTWMLVPSIITDDSKREAIISFLRWGLTKGQEFLQPLHYAPLPAPIVAKEEAAISNIKSSSQGRANPEGAERTAVQFAANTARHQ